MKKQEILKMNLFYLDLCSSDNQKTTPPWAVFLCFSPFLQESKPSDSDLVFSHYQILMFEYKIRMCYLCPEE